ncbi:hypothetical protein JTB14_016712 [Gonioctena quinquepunctata]|nr:hypothetical protein JTB14_016712 [Gonioctena quinquepunctata]
MRNKLTIFVTGFRKKVLKATKKMFSWLISLDLSKTIKPNTLWSRFSVLKAIMKIRQNVVIGKFYKLITFKKQSVDFKPKKAKVFSKDDIAKCMQAAPEDMYLLIKVATIFGLAGACRRVERGQY